MRITHLAHLKIHQYVLSSIKLLKTHQYPTKLNLNLDLIPIYIIHIKSLIHAILPHITQINLLPITPKIPSNLPLWIYHLLLLPKKTLQFSKNMTRDFHSWNIFFLSMHTGQTHSMYMKRSKIFFDIRKKLQQQQQQRLATYSP